MKQTYKKGERVGFTPVVVQILDILQWKRNISEQIQIYEERKRSNAALNGNRVGSMIYAFFKEIDPMLRRWINTDLEENRPKLEKKSVDYVTIRKMVTSTNAEENIIGYDLINWYLDAKGVLKIDYAREQNQHNIFEEDEEHE